MGQPAPWVAVPGSLGTRRGLSSCSVIKSELCKGTWIHGVFMERDELCAPTVPPSTKHEPEGTSNSWTLALARPSAPL